MSQSDLSQIYNFLSISDDLATAGQPTPAQLALLKDAGYEVVINLATGVSPNDVPEEGELLAAQGLDYIHIPVDWEGPTRTDLDRFFQAMAANRNRKRFVHCIANMRVSAFTFLYRVLQEGVPPVEAQQTLNKIWEPNEIWQRFIERMLADYED